MSIDFRSLRREYNKDGLSRKDLDENPFVQFEGWIEQAQKAGIQMPNAMSLATTDGDDIGIRTVLLKSFDENGFVFYTNYNSKKSRQINKHPKAALLFPWLELERQVKISGSVEKLSAIESIQYFSSRPRDSQLGAWASSQSSPINSKQILLSEFAKMKEKFAKGEVPLPDFWGGYRVLPESIEFWQGGENRLHDRFIYTKDKARWQIERLAP